MNAQSRRDAISDADTLVRVAWACQRPGCARHLALCANFAFRGLDAIAGRNRSAAGALEAGVAFTHAARWAFCAVPGLRDAQ